MSALAEESVCILQRGGFPFLVLEIVRKKSNGGSLFPIPRSHSPQSLQYRFLPKGEVKQAAINRVLKITLSILIPSNYFELDLLY